MKQNNQDTIPYQKIGEIKVFVNPRKLNQCDFTKEERNFLGEELMNVYASQFAKEEKDLIMIECFFPENGDLVFSLNILVKYQNLHSNISQYPRILDFINSITDLFSGTTLKLNEKISFSLAIKEYNFASYSIAMRLFEKAESEMLKESSEGKYILFETEKDLEKYFLDKIKENFHFINCHRLTGIHEIDIKMLESRYCISMGFTQAALSMLFITAEESLKTLLKYNLTKERLSESKEGPNLTEVGKVSLEAQKKYGSETLGVCIKFAKESSIITDSEEVKFKEMVKLRDGYIHSDKSRIFAKNKFPVQLVKIEDNKIKLVETKDMNINELIFAQGISQKSISDREAKRIFIEVEEMIHQICERFMKSYRTIE